MSKTNKSSEASVIKAEATAKGGYSFDDWLNKLELPQIAKAVQQIVMDIAKAILVMDMIIKADRPQVKQKESN